MINNKCEIEGCVKVYLTILFLNFKEKWFAECHERKHSVAVQVEDHNNWAQIT